MSAPALIIIDMQKGMARLEAGRRNNLQAEANIMRLLHAWRTAGAPVIHVRHVSKIPASPFWPGQPNADFQEELQPAGSELVVDKHVPDAFIHTGLELWLREHEIDQVVITGVSTNNSVEATARTCGDLGFTTTVVSDATFAFEKADYDGVEHSAEEVHAMSLANLQGEYAAIMRTSEISSMLAQEGHPAEAV